MLAIASAITNDNQIPSIPMIFNKMYAIITKERVILCFIVKHVKI